MASPYPSTSNGSSSSSSSSSGERKRHRRRSSGSAAAAAQARAAESAPPEGFVSVLGNGLVGAPLDSIGEPITGRGGAVAGVPGSAGVPPRPSIRERPLPPPPVSDGGAGPDVGGDPDDETRAVIFDDPEWREVRDAIARLELGVLAVERTCRASPSSPGDAPAPSSFLEDVFLHIFGGVLLLFILEQFVQIGILIGHKQYARAGLVPVNPASL